MDGRLLEVINILTEELEYSKDLATERKLENLYLKDELDKKDKRISELEMIDRGREVNDILHRVRDGDRLDESGKVKQILEEMEKKLKVFNRESWQNIVRTSKEAFLKAEEAISGSHIG